MVLHTELFLFKHASTYSIHANIHPTVYFNWKTPPFFANVNQIYQVTILQWSSTRLFKGNLWRFIGTMSTSRQLYGQFDFNLSQPKNRHQCCLQLSLSRPDLLFAVVPWGCQHWTCWTLIISQALNCHVWGFRGEEELYFAEDKKPIWLI